ncbi:hypothetical protein [uncultured Sphingomonas sp.]|uniref:hypothetical protein n=1 Tax=uncultured Sphingomonas sp. TaxID=158754 RepID=UPI0025D1C51C|nr:hypothetical protein [uncultured Sphingomonas sp.]
MLKPDVSFGTSAAIAARYRFAKPEELRKVLYQFCIDLDIDEPISIALMEENKVFHSNLVKFLENRKEYFAPSPARDSLGQSAANFMAAQSFSLLFDIDNFEAGGAISVPLVHKVMQLGAHGLYQLGCAQFESLAQVAVDIAEWICHSRYGKVVLIEAPLGNTVPVAVLASVLRTKGVIVDVVEWGCPRNDRALLGNTVAISAKDLATIDLIKEASFVVYIDDAITGSRFSKMAEALRREIGASRFGAIALRVRMNASAVRETRHVRDLTKIKRWANEIGMPFGVEVLPDMPLFNIDSHLPALLSTPLAWGDAGHAAGKKKINLLFYMIDRFEAISKELGRAGHSEARDFLHKHIWSEDVNGAQWMVLPHVAEEMHRRIINSLPSDFFAKIRDSAKRNFPDDYLGRAVTIAELRTRSDWLAFCIRDAALEYIGSEDANFLNRAVNNLSQAGYTAGLDAPPRDHDYGLYTVPLSSGEDILHRELVRLTVAHASTLSARLRHKDNP